MKSQLLDVLKWLFIFVVGSLIVSFIISPSSFSLFFDNIKSVLPKTQKSNLIAIDPAKEALGDNPYVLQYYGNLYHCSVLEAAGSMGGYNAKKLVCQEACGGLDMNYDSYSCNKDKITCYCYP